VKAGAVNVTCGVEVVRLDRFDTAIVSGSSGAYTLDAIGPSAAVLCARVPES
jgi:hypothetical protein